MAPIRRRLTATHPRRTRCNGGRRSSVFIGAGGGGLVSIGRERSRPSASRSTSRRRRSVPSSRSARLPSGGRWRSGRPRRRRGGAPAETAMTTLASPIGTTPMRCTMAMRAIGQRCCAVVADLAHLGDAPSPDRPRTRARVTRAPVVVVARRADEGHRRAGGGIGHRGRHRRGVDRMRDDLEHRVLAALSRRSPAESAPPRRRRARRWPRSTYSRLTAKRDRGAHRLELGMLAAERRPQVVDRGAVGQRSLRLAARAGARAARRRSAGCTRHAMLRSRARSPTTWPSSGRISFVIASSTAAVEPGTREDDALPGDAGGGAAQHRGGADLLVAEHAEQLAEAGDLLVEQAA